MSTEHEQHDEARAGWRIAPWCAGIGISVPGFYTLDPRPETVKIGRSTIITESPKNYLARAAALGGVKTVPYKKRRAA